MDCIIHSVANEQRCSTDARRPDQTPCGERYGRDTQSPHKRIELKDATH
jgi:hypothetical protein